MISQEVKRYWKAKINIIIALIMFFPTISAILTDLYEKNERFSEIEANIALGFDVSFALTQLEGWNGLFYFERLFSLHTGLLFLTFVVLVIGLGIHIAGNLFSALKTGYGINIITRMAYKSYLKNTIIAQTIYIFTFTLVIFLIILIALIIFGGGPIQTPNISRISRAGAMATPLYLLVLFGIIFYAIISKILLILIASLSCVFLKNKYIIQFIPVVFFVGIYVFTFMLGNLSYLLVSQQEH